MEGEFYAELQQIEAKYRAGKAEQLKAADRVIIYLVDFERIEDGGEVPFDDLEEEQVISVVPYESRTKILKQKVLGQAERDQLLPLLAAQVAKPEHSGGAMCHFPIHGLRVFRGDEKLFEGTFCWVCSNFSFSYPSGSQWLDTSAALQAVMEKLMPVPRAELERFYKKFPGARPKGERAAEVKAADQGSRQGPKADGAP